MNNATSSQEPPASALRGIASVIALALLCVALLLVYTYPADPTPEIPVAAGFAAAGIALFLAARTMKTTPAEAALNAKIRLTRRGAWTAAAVLMSIMTAVMMLAFMRFDRQNYLPVIGMWFGAMACYLAAFSAAPPLREDIRRWLRGHWKECLAVAAITALGAGLRFHKLGDLPRVINGDEGWIGNVALSTISPPLANPFALWENFGGLHLQIINLAFVFLGVSTFSLRLIPAVAGTLAIPATYLLARQVADKRVALFTAILLAVSHTHMNYSRTAAVGYIQDTWFVPLELFLLLSGLRQGNRLRAAAAGVLMGIQFAIYLTPQIFSMMLAVFSLLVLLLFRRRLSGAGRVLAAFWGALAVSIIPQAVFAAGHADEFFNRLNTDGTFQSGWLSLQTAATGKGVSEILAGRVAHAFLTLIAYPSIDFYGSFISVLSLFTGIFFLIGLALALRRTLRLNYLLLNGYFWVGPVAIGLFAIPESADSYRMLMVLPAAMLMAAIGLDAALEAIGAGWNSNRNLYVGVAAFILVNLFVFNQWAYFVDHAGKCRYGGDSQTRFASYLGRFLATLEPLDPVYLLSDTVYRYGTHLSVDFLSQNKSVTNVPDAIDTIDPISGDILIASPNRIQELLDWAHRHPGGELEAFFDCETLFVLVYRVP
ncbi:MAG: glycosyltransferase family 39 protein [Anaerolineales bacterium]|nr:glycosyltransferase family 39 protein [Anaerolineales bacterium]